MKAEQNFFADLQKLSQQEWITFLAASFHAASVQKPQFPVFIDNLFDRFGYVRNLLIEHDQHDSLHLFEDAFIYLLESFPQKTSKNLFVHFEMLRFLTELKPARHYWNLERFICEGKYSGKYFAEQDLHLLLIQQFISLGVLRPGERVGSIIWNLVYGKKPIDPYLFYLAAGYSLASPDLKTRFQPLTSLLQKLYSGECAYELVFALEEYCVSNNDISEVFYWWTGVVEDFLLGTNSITKTTFTLLVHELRAWITRGSDRFQATFDHDGKAINFSDLFHELVHFKPKHSSESTFTSIAILLRVSGSDSLINERLTKAGKLFRFLEKYSDLLKQPEFDINIQDVYSSEQAAWETGLNGRVAINFPAHTSDTKVLDNRTYLQVAAMGKMDFN
jgi:hypothetical protein